MTNNKKQFKKSDLVITILIVLGITVVLNFFSYQMFLRFDLTENKDYSISDISKNIVSELDDVLNIRVYFSKDLPNQYVNLGRDVNDILDEYRTYSDGKVKVDFIDPQSLENPEQELYMMGIPPLEFNVLEKDKYQVVRGYLGVVVEYGDKKEVIPVVDSTNNLEYQVSLAIKKATADEFASLGYVTSHGCLDLESAVSVASQKLRELYQIQNIDLKTAEEIQPDIDTLIILGPTEKFDEDVLKKIDSFVMRGGALVVMADGVSVGDRLDASVNEIDINELLEKYGLKLNSNLVSDVSNAMTAFSSGFYTFSTSYPLWPMILKTNFDKDNASVAKLETLVLPWASSINILREDAKISKLARTTERASTQTENFNLNPQQVTTSGVSYGQYNLAVSVFGKMDSKYGDVSTETGKLVLVGDSDFIQDGYLRQFPENLTFFQNLIDSVSLDDDLINIRSKGVTERPIKELSDAKKSLIKYLNIFGITFIVVVFGMVRYYFRRKNRT